MHQNTSLGAGYRGSLEGWSKAGIKYVEIAAPLLDDFLKSDNLAAAGRVYSDLGLTAVGGGCEGGLIEPDPNRAAALDRLKKRCEQYSALKLTQVAIPCLGNQPVTADDYKRGVDRIREVGDVVKQYRMTAMIEFIRGTSFLATLPTALKLIREANHPNVRPMIDIYLFWSGMSRFDDLDLIKQGEIGHVHWGDVPDTHRELLTNLTRTTPGDGVAPLAAILRKLAEKGYAGPASIELFGPQYQQADPYTLARQIREKAEPIMRKAGVL